MLAVSAHVKDVERHLQEITGTDPGRLGCDSGLNLESFEGRRFLRLVKFAIQELSANPSALDNLVVRRQLDHLVLE